jgi:transposase
MATTARRTIPHVPVRYRCGSCGNLTRFDVVATRRTSAFHHYSVGGDLTVEEEELLEERVERVTCRWCGASGDNIEEFDGSPSQAPAPAATVGKAADAAELSIDEAAAPADPA